MSIVTKRPRKYLQNAETISSFTGGYFYLFAAEPFKRLLKMHQRKSTNYRQVYVVIAYILLIIAAPVFVIDFIYYS